MIVVNSREDARQYIQDHSTDILKLDGCKKGYVCPICGSGSGRNGTGIATKDGIHYTCWAGCFSNADIIDIIGIKNGMQDYNSKLDIACREFGVTIESTTPTTDNRRHYYIKDGKKVIEENGKITIVKDAENRKQAETEQEQTDYTDFFLQANKDLCKTDYHRGISLETLNRFKIGYIENWKHPKAPTAPASPRLIIPTSQHSYLARDIRANLTDIQKKYSKSKVGKTHIFNEKTLATATQPIFIVEGEIDALSIIDVGGEAIGLGSVTTIDRFLMTVADKHIEQPFIIALDNDKAGQNNTSKLAEGLKNLKYSVTILNRFNDYKDANEALQADRKAFTELVTMAIENAEDTAGMEEDLETMEKEAERIALEAENASNSIASFRQAIEDSKTASYYSTGFTELDNLLNGGLYAGLYFVGAISSLGKTTFCLQVADNIAKSGTDVLIFSLEMARNELIAKSVSRLTYINNSKVSKYTSNAKNTLGVLIGSKYKNYSPTEIALIDQSIKDYEKYGKHIYISEGIGNIGVDQIKERVKRHIDITGKAPVVLIDYIQILAPSERNRNATDKQKTDDNVMELKRLSRDYNIPVIGISSFNRSNYTEPVNLASFKESGAIEYSSDVLIGLQYDGMDYETVTKNRKDGTTYEALESDQERGYRVKVIMDNATEVGKLGQAVDIQVKILKNRNGTKGETKLKFVPMFNYFYEQATSPAKTTLVELEDDILPFD